MIRTTAAVIVAALSFVTPALAKGGHVTFDGGTSLEQQNVTDALAVSTFNFNQLPNITVRIVPSLPPGESGEAVAGTVTLVAGFLDQGIFAFGTVQHEFAHEVDYLLLSDAQRQEALTVLGASAWYSPSLAHADQGRERFATTLAWTFWPDRLNNQAPGYKGSEVGNTTKFHALLVRWGLAAPVCRLVKVKRGHYVAYRVRIHGKWVTRHRWVKPVYRRVCG